jgi:excisionase family DNA binding protein
MSERVHIDPDRVYSISTAARFLGVSPSTLRDLERQGRLACTRTPGGQRRFAGAELLRLQEESVRRPARPTRPTSSGGAATPEEAQARRAWLGALIARAQRELPLDTPGEIRLRLGADLERALRDLGPASPCDAVDPLVRSLIDRAKRQTKDAQEDARRRETKGLLLEYALGHLRRSVDALPRRMVGAPDSPKRRHVRATLREQLRDQLQKRLTGDEAWHEVRDLVEEFVAAWYVAQPSGRRLPDAVKLLAAGMSGAAGGAAAVAALNPRIRAEAAKLKDRLLSRVADLAKRLRTPPPSASPPPNPARKAATPPAQ